MSNRFLLGLWVAKGSSIDVLCLSIRFSSVFFRRPNTCSIGFLRFPLACLCILYAPTDPHGFSIDSLWDPIGFLTDYLWIAWGFPLDSLWCTMASHGFPMESLRIPYGFPYAFPVESQWIDYWLLLDSIRIRCGFPYGFPVDSLWIPWALRKNSASIPYGLPVDSLCRPCGHARAITQTRPAYRGESKTDQLVRTEYHS